MKTDFETNTYKRKKIYIKSYTGLYPPGAYIAWPQHDKVNKQGCDEMPYRRTKAGGLIALPVNKK